MRLYARRIECYTYKCAQSPVQRGRRRVYGEWLWYVVRCDTLYLDVDGCDATYVCLYVRSGT